ncbi:MAG: acyltransferase family protein [Vicinamibacterales bacterium]
MTTAVHLPEPARRLLSLDVARGITIAFMIMVNNNGGSPWGFMNHAAWNGLTATDLVFPTFVFVVGISAVFAIEGRLARGATRRELVRHTVQRAIILCLLGIVVNSFPFFKLEHMRFYGVLQRIAVCYLAVSLFYLWNRERAWPIATALMVVLVGYWILVRWVPVPGAGVPGRDVPFLDVHQNLVSWIDRQLFPHHLYRDLPDHNVRDPEGLLSDLPAIGTALMGMLTGVWLRTRRAIPEKTRGLAVATIGSLALGYLWALWFPLNKNMWTSSYVLVAGGYSLALVTLAFWAVEQKGWRTGWTWIWLVFGSNAIAAYMFSELLPGVLHNVHFMSGGRRTDVISFAFDDVFARIPDPGWAAFAYSVSFTAVCFVPVWMLYRRRIFLKL